MVPLQSIIALHDGTNEVLLTTARADIMADLDYQVNDGWVAFTKPGGGGVLQLWTRGPDGVERQVWSVGAHSRIHALGPGGQVVFSSGTRRYLSAPPYTEAPDDIGNAWLELSPPSRVLWVDGELVVTLGRSAFRIH